MPNCYECKNNQINFNEREDRTMICRLASEGKIGGITDITCLLKLQICLLRDILTVLVESDEEDEEEELGGI